MRLADALAVLFDSSFACLYVAYELLPCYKVAEYIELCAIYSETY